MMQPHGHVIPRQDGCKALCGGPKVCLDCQAEQTGILARLMSGDLDERLLDSMRLMLGTERGDPLNPSMDRLFELAKLGLRAERNRSPEYLRKLLQAVETEVEQRMREAHLQRTAESGSKGPLLLGDEVASILGRHPKAAVVAFDRKAGELRPVIGAIWEEGEYGAGKYVLQTDIER